MMAEISLILSPSLRICNRLIRLTAQATTKAMLMMVTISTDETSNWMSARIWICDSNIVMLVSSVYMIISVFFSMAVISQGMMT